MKLKLKRCSAFAGLATMMVLSDGSAAVDPDHFKVRTNSELVALCSTMPDDPLYVAAIHFCHGFGVGAYRYSAALSGDGDHPAFVCLPEDMTRSQIIDRYVAYSKAHPQYDRDAAVHVMFKFLIETWPCEGS